MSPTVFRVRGYRFFFFSREEQRMHVHVSTAEGEAKYWLEPVVALVEYSNLSPRQLREIELIIRNKREEIVKAWKKHFRS